jgi:hypothetical protein
MNLIQFDEGLEIKNTTHRQAFQLLLVETIQKLEDIKKAGTPDTKKMFMRQQIARTQKNACRLLHFVEGYNIDELPKRGPRNGINCRGRN